MINEENLMLYYYNDGLSAAERSQVEAAIQDDALLAARYADICRHLDGLTESATETAPAQLVQRLHGSIDRAASLERQKDTGRTSPLHFMSFFWGAAITAALAIGIAIGLTLSGPKPAGVVQDGFVANNQTVSAGTGVPVAFTRGLQVHLQQSQAEISQLAVADDVMRGALVMQIVQQNRLFERTASVNNSPELARILRAFEPVLLRLASDDISPEDAAALRAQLSFELNVVLTKLSRSTSDVAETI